MQTKTQFGPDFTLLAEGKEGKGKDTDRYLEEKLKSPKENRTGKAVVMKVYKSRGTLCPVKALEMWESRADTE